MKIRLPFSFYLHFRYKLIIFLIMFSFIPTAGIGISSYHLFSKTIREQTTENIRGTLKQIGDNIDYKRSSLERMSEQIYTDTNFQRLFKEEYYDEQKRYEVLNNVLIPKCTSVLELSQDNVFMNIYNDNVTLPEINFFDVTPSDPLLRGKQFQILNMDRLKSQEWYSEQVEKYDKGLWGQLDSDKKYGNISYARNIINTDDFSICGMLHIIIKLEDLFDAVDYKKIGAGSGLTILDDNDTVIFKSVEFQQMDPANNSINIAQTLKGFDYKLVASIPLSITEQQARKVSSLTFIVCLIVFILSVLVSFLVTEFLSKNINRIIASLNAFREGDLKKRIYFKGKDEFAQMALAFNNMAETTENLIEKVYTGNLQRKELEMQVLQAQINPHFLYNTLYSIYRLSRFEKKEELQKMIMDLSKFYRLSLNGGKKLTTVANELQQIKSYIEIQQIKYGDSFRVSYDIDERMLDFSCLNFILQPFVENIFEHALYRTRVNARISIQREEQTTVFMVIDDGIGMKRERVESSLNIKKPNGGYGIRNVDERIKLLFGEEYGVEITSIYCIGTTVRIVMPVLPDKPGEGGHNTTI